MIGAGDADIMVSLTADHQPTENHLRTLRAAIPRAFPGVTFYFLPADIVTQVFNFGILAPVDMTLEASRNADAHVSPDDRARVLGWLETSQREFFAAIDDVSDAQWGWKPAPERWSVAETAEHIVVAEGLLFQIVQRALEGPPNVHWQEETRGKTELLIQVLPSGEGKAAAPAPFKPREQLTRAQVKDRLASQRIDIVRFASGTDVPLREFTRVHPFPEFGTLNAYQWLIYVPLHTLRHSKQIAELKATPGFPAE